MCVSQGDVHSSPVTLVGQHIQSVNGHKSLCSTISKRQLLSLANGSAISGQSETPERVEALVRPLIQNVIQVFCTAC